MCWFHSYISEYLLGFSNQINHAGVDYYKKIIKLLKENNIEPLVTMFHWDLPQPLQEIGGWTNEIIVNWFVEYAKKCFEFFGDTVKYWFTINEALTFCVTGYDEKDTSFNMIGAPAANSSGIGEYLCAHNILKAHAKVWHIYDKEFRAKQKGKCKLINTYLTRYFFYI